MRHAAPADYSPPFTSRSFMSSVSRTLLLLTAIGCLACSEKPAKVAQAQTLGPEDIQLVSSDKSFALELIGDSVHVYMPGSRVSVPSTYIENMKYGDGRLRFDIRGLGVRIFDVGPAFGDAKRLMGLRPLPWGRTVRAAARSSAKDASAASRA